MQTAVWPIWAQSDLSSHPDWPLIQTLPAIYIRGVLQDMMLQGKLQHQTEMRALTMLLSLMYQSENVLYLMVAVQNGKAGKQKENTQWKNDMEST